MILFKAKEKKKGGPKLAFKTFCDVSRPFESPNRAIKAQRGLRKTSFEAEEVPNLLLKIVRHFQNFKGLKKARKDLRKAMFGAEEVPNSLLKFV